jgi:hypothetical protein
VASDRVTLGDVRAHFQAFEGAGTLIFTRAGEPAASLAAPSNPLEHAIRPFGFWDGLSFCEEDWHLLALTQTIAALEGEPKITRAEGEAFLEPLVVDLLLDGELVTDTERTPIKRLIQALQFNQGGTVEVVSGGWWFQTGAFFGPGELAVGPHTLSARTTDPQSGVSEAGPITFHIDASGTGSCV